MEGICQIFQSNLPAQTWSASTGCSGQPHPVRFGVLPQTETSQPLPGILFPLLNRGVNSSGQIEFCMVLFVSTVSPPVTGHCLEEFGFLLLIPLHQVYSDMDSDPTEPPDPISSETEQLSHIFSDNISTWSPFSSCLSVITSTDPTICLNYWSLFLLIQFFNAGKYLQQFPSATQFYSNPLSSK